MRFKTLPVSLPTLLPDQAFTLLLRLPVASCLSGSILATTTVTEDLAELALDTWHLGHAVLLRFGLMVTRNAGHLNFSTSQKRSFPVNIRVCDGHMRTGMINMRLIGALIRARYKVGSHPDQRSKD